MEKETKKETVTIVFDTFKIEVENVEKMVEFDQELQKLVEKYAVNGNYFICSVSH